MKKLVVLLMVSLIASSAFAVVDPDPDMVGMYFDPMADTYCFTAAPYATVIAYMILTNPTMDAIGGFELGYHFTGAAMVLSTTFTNPQALNVGGPDNMIVGFGSPQVCSEATVLATLSVLYMDTTMGPVYFYLTGTEPSSIDPTLPTLLMTDDSLVTAGLSTLPGTAGATINGICGDIVDTEDASWDGVKSLYR